MSEQIKYPATATYHWVSGPVNACDEHGKGLIKLGQFMGYQVGVSPLKEFSECSNCVNENKEQK